VEPATVRLKLSDGDWIDVKQELTTGEQRAMFADMRRRLGPGELPTLDPAQVSVARAKAYLVGWSFVDKDQRPVPVSASAIDQLDTRTFTEITTAVDLHEQATEAAWTDEKKTSTPSTGTGTTLRSVS